MIANERTTTTRFLWIKRSESRSPSLPRDPTAPRSHGDRLLPGASRDQLRELQEPKRGARPVREAGADGASGRAAPEAGSPPAVPLPPPPCPCPARRAPRKEPRGTSALEDPGLVGRETCDCIAVTGCVQCDNRRRTRSRTPPAPRQPQPVRSRGTGRAAGAPGRFPPFTLNAGEGPGLCPRGRRAP